MKPSCIFAAEKTMFRYCFVLVLTLFVCRLCAQSSEKSVGHFTRQIDPNLMGFEGLYCGNITFIPFPLNYTEKMRIAYLEADLRTISPAANDFSATYADTRNILYSTKHANGNIASMRYKLFDGYKNSHYEELIISISSSGGTVKQPDPRHKGEDITLFAFFTGDESNIRQIECYKAGKFPSVNCSATITDNIICIDNDTLEVNVIEGQNQVISIDRKRRPVDFWIYDNKDRLIQYRHYQWGDIGLVRIDSTNITWENDKVKKISTRDKHTICTYDSTAGYIRTIENYTKNQLVKRYEYTYTFDHRYNWTSFLLLEVNVAKNSKTRKFFVKREITYRE